jgi:hypothetical protein
MYQQEINWKRGVLAAIPLMGGGFFLQKGE